MDPRYPAVVWEGKTGCPALNNEKKIRAVMVWEGACGPVFEEYQGGNAMGELTWTKYNDIPQEFLKDVCNQIVQARCSGRHGVGQCPLHESSDSSNA